MSADLMFEDYKLKLEYVRGQYERLWQRFNFFLTIQLALFGFLGYLTFDVRIIEATVLPAWLGLIISVLWYVVGAEDRRLVEVYRQRADDAATRFARDPEGLRDFDKDHAAAHIPSSWQTVRSWYWSPVSVTRMPATLGLMFTIVWIVVLVAWQEVAADLSQAASIAGSSAAP
jgi:hypothetical protein